MKRIISIILTLMMVVGIVPMFATTATAAPESDFGFYNGVITSYSGTEADLVIPSTIGGVPVKEIGQFAFWNNPYVRSVTIPEGVTRINASAFQGCSNLRSVSIPASVNFIGDNAFRDASRLSEVKYYGINEPRYGNFVFFNTSRNVIVRTTQAYRGWYFCYLGVSDRSLVPPQTSFTATVGNGTGDGEYKEGATVTITADNPQTGYKFTGWTSTDDVVFADATAATTTFVMPGKDVAVQANYAPDTFAIKFVVDNEIYATITQEYGTAITAPADPTKTGYTFAGWDKEIPATMPAEDMTIIGSFDINVYNITIVPSQYGTVVAKVNGEVATTACYGDEVVLEVTPNDGHSFVKLNYYFSLDNGSGAGGSLAADLAVTMKNGDLKITPVFDVNEYTITFIVDGEVYETITADYGTAITAPETPVKTGYTFSGWDKEIPATMPAEDVTISASWNVNAYTITFMSDGKVYKTITQNYGTAITAPANPTKTGYTFAGWDKTIPATMPAESMTITAKWTANKYVVKFDGTGNGVYATMKDQYFVYDVPQALNKNEFIRDGYRFLGWTTSEGGELIFGDEEEVMNLVTEGEITLYPVWELAIGVLNIKPILVHVMDTDHGEVTMNRKMVPYNTYAYLTVTPDDGYELDTITAFTKYGYELKVYDNGDGTYKIKMPMSQVNVTATFKKIEVAPVHECPGAKFEDLSTEAWYHEAVDYMIENNLMNGTADTKFSPDATLNRAMIATILWRLEGEPKVDFEMSFTDVEADQWYTEAIRWAASAKIVEGFEDGTFKPTNSITRQQLAVMIYRYEQYKGGGFKGAWMFRLDYADVADVADWAYEAICWTTMNDIYAERDGLLEATATATRAEAAAMIYNYAK